MGKKNNRLRGYGGYKAATGIDPETPLYSPAIPEGDLLA